MTLALVAPQKGSPEVVLSRFAYLGFLATADRETNGFVA